jgi:hypothetical protein
LKCTSTRWGRQYGDACEAGPIVAICEAGAGKTRARCASCAKLDGIKVPTARKAKRKPAGDALMPAWVESEIDRAVRKARREERRKLLRASFVECVRAVRRKKP